MLKLPLRIEFINEPINYYYGDGTEKDDIFETKNINEAEIMSLQNLPFKDEVEKLGGEIYAVGGASGVRTATHLCLVGNHAQTSDGNRDIDHGGTPPACHTERGSGR